MAMKRDEKGRLVITKVIDGKEVVTKVIPKQKLALFISGTFLLNSSIFFSWLKEWPVVPITHGVLCKEA